MTDEMENKNEATELTVAHAADDVAVDDAVVADDVTEEAATVEVAAEPVERAIDSPEAAVPEVVAEVVAEEDAVEEVVAEVVADVVVEVVAEAASGKEPSLEVEGDETAKAAATFAILDSLKKVDLDWAKESLSAVRERRETLHAISDAKTGIEALQAELDALNEELREREDVAARYDEIRATQGAIIDAAQSALVKAEANLAEVVAEMKPAQAKLDEIRSIHERLIKPYEDDYNNLREQMRAAEEVLAKAQAVVDEHSVVKKRCEDEIASIRGKLLVHEEEMTKVANKRNLSVSEKMKQSNAIAAQMGVLQQRVMELQDTIDAEDRAMAPDLRRVRILTEDKEPLSMEFELVKRDFLRQRELFKRQNAPLLKELDEVQARFESANQEVSDCRTSLQSAEAVLQLAQDVVEHPEKTESLRRAVRDKEDEIRQQEAKKTQLSEQEQELRGKDGKGKLLIAGFAVLAVIVTAVISSIC